MTSIDDFEPRALGAPDPLATIQGAVHELGAALGQVKALTAAAGALPAELAGAASSVTGAVQHFSDKLLHAAQGDASSLLQRTLHAGRFDAILNLTQTIGTAVEGLEPYLQHTVTAIEKLPSALDVAPAAVATGHEDLSAALDALGAAVAGLGPAEELGGARLLGVAISAAKAAVAEAPAEVQSLLAQILPQALIHEAANHMAAAVSGPAQLAATGDGGVHAMEIAVLVLQILQRLADYFQAVAQLGLQIQIGGGANGALSGIVGWAAGVAAHLGVGGEAIAGVAVGTTAIDITGGIGAALSAVFALARLVVSTRIAWVKAEGPPAPAPSLADVAAEAEAEYVQRAAQTTPASRAELAETINASLDAARPKLEEFVRAVHPALEAVDASANQYRFDAGTVMLHGTLEALLDAQAPPSRTLAIGEILFTRPEVAGEVTRAVSGGLAGTGAQRRVNPYPGDVDLGEAVTVQAPTLASAAASLAKAVQESLTRAQAARVPLPLLALGMRLPYPKDHAQAGLRMTWTAAEVAAGQVELDGRAYTLAEALAQPTPHPPNTYWRTAIDDQGTWGEVTKVLTYRLHASGDGATAGTPAIGQDYQAVSFSPLPFADTARLALADALLPAVANNLSTHPLKANKRAYTITRLFDDVAAGQSIAPQLSGPTPRRAQVTEHLSLFTEEVIAPDAVGAACVDAAQAAAMLVRLEARVRVVDPAAGTALAVARAKAPADPRGDGTLTAALRAVVATLEAAGAADAVYSEATRSALAPMTFLFPKSAPAAGPDVAAPAPPKSLAEAHRAWRDGELGAAQEGYAKLASTWSARLQRAWIDAPFGGVDAATLDDLEATAPGPEARARVTALRGHIAAGARLPGDAMQWSLHQLAANGHAGKVDFWLARGSAAAKAAQYGLAHACFARAETLALPAEHAPAALASTNHQAAAHLAVL